MKLLEHPFIQSISEQRRDALLDEIEILKLKHSDIIFRQNSSSDALYLILEGSVSFNKRKQDGSNQHIITSDEGSSFGEVGVFTEEKRALEAIAKTDCVIGRVPKKTAKKIIEDAEPAKRVLDSVIKHLRSTTSQYMIEMMRKEKLSLIGTMISSILHDFKNPFSIIMLGAHIIEQRHGADDPKTKEICKNIDAQLRRMMDMASDLGSFARGDSEIQIRPVSIHKLFQQFKELHSPFFHEENVSIEMHANGVSLEADANKLLRVLQNLVENAIEAIHQGKKPGKIVINATDKGQTIYISISDDGPGIPDEIQSRFFEPFVTHGKNSGTGLGTAIVRSIVDAHHGNIIFSTTRAGTMFTIQLPKVSK
jgi:signal transduction histidine kinase